MFETVDNGKLKITTELKKLLSTVQKDGNREVNYKTDIENHGEWEKWAFPKKDGFKLYGDCEDISIYKYKKLIEAGVPKDPLLMVICTMPDGSGHCVLSVATDKRDYILCNNHFDISFPSLMRIEGYKFLYRQHLGSGIDHPWDVLR